MKCRMPWLLLGLLTLLSACSGEMNYPNALTSRPIRAQSQRKPLLLKAELGYLRQFKTHQQKDQSSQTLRTALTPQKGLRTFQSSSGAPAPELRILPLLPPENLPAPILAEEQSPYPPLPQLPDFQRPPVETAPTSPNLPNQPQPVQPPQSPSNSFRYADIMWHLRKTNIEKAWQITRGNSEQIVAVIDTGLDYFHPAFRGKVLMGYDFANHDPDPMDEAAHGTHVAGIIAGNDGNIQGIAPAVKILAIKIFSAQGFAQGEFALARAIRYAVESGASIINLSLGSPTLFDCGIYSDYMRALHSAIDEAYAQGVSIVTAAGNGALDFINGRCSIQQNVNQIPVIATNEGDQLASFSNHANHSHPKAIAAPGVNIFSSIPMRLVCNEQRCDMPYDYMDGTSMASPIVSGALALIRSAMYQDYVRTIQRRNTRLAQGQTPQRVLSFREFFHEQAALAQTQLSLALKPAQLAERLLFSHTNQPARRIPQGLIYEGSRDPIFGFGRVDIGSAVEAASRVFTLAGL